MEILGKRKKREEPIVPLSALPFTRGAQDFLQTHTYRSAVGVLHTAPRSGPLTPEGGPIVITYVTGEETGSDTWSVMGHFQVP